jgi:Orsellinic acid/F9775 biosynthesis cluster protein D
MLSDLSAFSVLRTINGCFAWCHDCNFAVRGSFITHLQRKHSTSDSPGLRKVLETRPDLEALLETGAKAPKPWPNGVRPIAGIPVEVGYQCLICQRLRPSKPGTKRHLREEHGIGVGNQEYYRTVDLQTWFPTSTGGFGACWIVDYNVHKLHELQLPTFYDSIPAHDTAYRDRLRRFLALAPAYRDRLRRFLALAPAMVFDQPKKLLKKGLQSPTVPGPISSPIPSGIPVPNDVLYEPSFVGTQQKDDSTRFLERSSWRPLFQQLPYVQAMRTMTKPPLRVNAAKADLVLLDPATEPGLGRFLASDEAILNQVLELFKAKVLGRCKETVAQSLLGPRCWLQSPWPDRTSLTAFGWQEQPETLEASGYEEIVLHKKLSLRRDSILRIYLAQRSFRTTYPHEGVTETKEETTRGSLNSLVLTKI